MYYRHSSFLVRNAQNVKRGAGEREKEKKKNVKFILVLLVLFCYLKNEA
jgi:hypothetical protein